MFWGIKFLHNMQNGYLGYMPVVMGGESYRCDTDHVRFWRTVTHGAWEPHTLRLLDRVLRSESVYCDVGSWIGPTVLFAARRCKAVYAFEPDPISYGYLIGNVRRNGMRNVVTFHAAVTTHDGIATIGTFAKTFGRSKTSLLAVSSEAIDVPGWSWESCLKVLPSQDIDVLKVDIEGGEFDLLPSVRTYLQHYSPILYLSLHPQFLPEEQREAKMKKVIACLQVYERWYDAALNEISPEDLLGARSLAQGREIVLTNAPLGRR